MKIHTLKYSNTNTYLIEGEKGKLLFDTGWAGTFPAFCKCLGELGIRAGEIDYILISHFHPDHCGIAQQIAELSPVILVMDTQKDHIHDADGIFAKEYNREFKPVDEEGIRLLSFSQSREFLQGLGIKGEIFSTPGHSDDGISLWLDTGALFVGDLNPLYELALHKDTDIGRSWERLLLLKPRMVYYGHAKTAVLQPGGVSDAQGSGREDGKPNAADMGRTESVNTNEADPCRAESISYELVARIKKCLDRGMNRDKIRRKTGADEGLIEDVTRMYMTHPNVGVQGIIDRIEIKGK